MLHVTVVEAENLMAKDKYKHKEDSSDPYVKLKHGKSRFKTTVHREDLNPHWDESFDIEIDENDPSLAAEVFDKDRLRDDFLGVAVIHLPDFMDGDVHDRWFVLEDKKGGKKGVKGRLRLRLQMQGARFHNHAGEDGFGDGVHRSQSSIVRHAGGAGYGAHADADDDSSYAISSDSDDDQPADADSGAFNVAVVKVIEARDLSSRKLDPYVMVMHGHQVQQTLVIEDNMHPRWEEQFVLDIHQNDPDLIFELYDKEMLVSDKCIGQVIVPLEDYKDGEIHDEWHVLKRKKGEGSALKRLSKLQLRKNKVVGELRVEIVLEKRDARVADYERSTFIRKSGADPVIFEGVYILFIIFVVILLKIFFDI